MYDRTANLNSANAKVIMVTAAFIYAYARTCLYISIHSRSACQIKIRQSWEKSKNSESAKYDSCQYFMPYGNTFNHESLSLLQQERTAERQEDRLHGKAVRAAAHGNIGRAVVLEVSKLIICCVFLSARLVPDSTECSACYYHGQVASDSGELVSFSLTLARACAAKGYCSPSVRRSVGRSVGRSVSLWTRFLSNRGCCRYQTWICGYVQRALGTARLWNVVVKEQRVYGGG